MNTVHDTTTEDMPEFTEADRAAMRAYLQRTEVRLSTLHRIATAFIGGAGSAGLGEANSVYLWRQMIISSPPAYPSVSA